MEDNISAVSVSYMNITVSTTFTHPSVRPSRPPESFASATCILSENRSNAKQIYVEYPADMYVFHV